MAGVKKKVESKRYNLVVPTNDTDVLQWMALQNNFSQSIRQLIKNEIQKGGFNDLFCKTIANPGVAPGRPAKVSHEPSVAEGNQQMVSEPVAQVVEQPKVVANHSPVKQVAVAEESGNAVLDNFAGMLG